jgi:hypothetical protein
MASALLDLIGEQIGRNFFDGYNRKYSQSASTYDKVWALRLKRGWGLPLVKVKKAKKAVVERTPTDIDEYVARIKLLREITSGDSQNHFADKIGIDMKRWNNFERGYPLPRDVAFLLVDKLPGMSVDWIWFGWTGNLSPEWKRKLMARKFVSLKR